MTEHPDLSDTPIDRCIRSWHELIEGRDPSGLDVLLTDDATLHSPVLFRPQHGKELVTMYLSGALMTFVGDGSPRDPARTPSGEGWDGQFRYLREILGTHDAMLEFETTMHGRYVNGVDIITCNDDGLIVDFKVMVRPLQALDAVREQMLAALELLNGGAS